VGLARSASPTDGKEKPNKKKKLEYSAQKNISHKITCCLHLFPAF